MYKAYRNNTENLPRLSTLVIDGLPLPTFADSSAVTINASLISCGSRRRGVMEQGDAERARPADQSKPKEPSLAEKTKGRLKCPIKRTLRGERARLRCVPW